MSMNFKKLAFIPLIMMVWVSGLSPPIFGIYSPLHLDNKKAALRAGFCPLEAQGCETQVSFLRKLSPRKCYPRVRNQWPTVLQALEQCDPWSKAMVDPALELGTSIHVV